MAISSFIVPSVLALEFTIDASEIVQENTPFGVTLNVDSADSYDVKIFAHQGDKNSYVSQMNDGGAWRSPRTYMKEAFPSQETYEVKIVEFVGEAELCARLRKTGTSSFSEVCQPITVGESVEQVPEEPVIEEERVAGPQPREAESNVYTNPMRTRIVYAFMAFCAAVIGLLWLGKL